MTPSRGQLRLLSEKGTIAPGIVTTRMSSQVQPLRVGSTWLEPLLHQYIWDQGLNWKKEA